MKIDKSPKTVCLVRQDFEDKSLGEGLQFKG